MPGDNKTKTALFNNYKYCNVCRRPLSLTYEEDLCPTCQENELFSKVKEYIRAHDVNEFDVSEHFNVPLKRVKKWIREGRIEYKELDNSNLVNLHCQKCGVAIQFGNLCVNCMRIANTSGNALQVSSDEDNRLRYLDKD